MGAAQFVANGLSRSLGQIFPGFFPGKQKNYAKDFGYPEFIGFHELYRAYSRHGLANAGVEKTILKTWQDSPNVWETEEPQETALEAEIRQKLDDLRFWQKIIEADRRALVGGYSALILRYADDSPFSAPVDFVRGGLDGLIELIPVWAGQLTVARWNTDPRSPDYGKPLAFNFNEAEFEGARAQGRSFQIHPDRVFIWSADGGLHGRAMLEPGYNALLDLEKICGAGGEGFWKNSRGSLVIEFDKETDIQGIAASMGVTPEDLANKIGDQVEEFNNGFDSSFIAQGVKVSNVPVTLPSPEHFFAVALQMFAASISIPIKVLTGNQTGERASSEDNAEWNATNAARRRNVCAPNIRALLDRLEKAGILPERDWHVNWTDLTESSGAEKIERGSKMAEINAKQAAQGEPVYTVAEIREATGYEGDGPDIIEDDDE